MNSIWLELTSKDKILKSTDGAFAQMSQFLFAKRFDLPQNHLNSFLETLNKISPKRLQELAVKYLDWDKMVVVVVGLKPILPQRLDINNFNQGASHMNPAIGFEFR